MEDSSGFYKLDSGELLFGPNFIEGPTFILNRENKDSYIYPVQGWYWFDTIDDAKLFFNIKDEPTQ